MIDDFAKAAGVSRGTFYNYFLSTRELLDACLNALFDKLIAQIDPVVASESNPVLRLATALMHGTTVFALRSALPAEAHGDAVMRAVLMGLGVKPALIRRALAQPLPELRRLDVSEVYQEAPAG